MGKKEPEKNVIIEEGAPEWVVTFGDLMSLLLCFFVLLLSFSEMDRQKYKVMTGSLKEAFGVERKRNVMGILMGEKIVPRTFDQDTVALELKDNIADQVRFEFEQMDKQLQHMAEVVVSDSEVTIRLMGETAFDSGKAEIRPEMVPVLSKIGDILGKVPGDIVVGGHTDNVPLSGGVYGSNLVLSMARATKVAEFLIDVAGAPPERVVPMGFGEYRPIATNDTPEGRQRNRRVEITLTLIPFKNAVNQPDEGA